MCYTNYSVKDDRDIIDKEIEYMLLKKKTNRVTPIKTPTPQKKEQVISSAPLSITHEGDSMKDLFFIIKGQYAKGVEPSFVNKVSGDVSYIGGYDPYNDDTEQWYMVLDKMTFNCISCGSSKEKALKSIYTIIKKYKGSAKKYFKYISETTSDDYYETHYLGRSPLNHEQRVKKAEGRCPRVSPVMQELYKHIYSEYGDFYRDEIEEMENLAYHDLEEWVKENKPINKTKKRMGKVKVQKPEMEKTPQKKEEDGRTTPKKVKPLKKLGVKKLK